MKRETQLQEDAKNIILNSLKEFTKNNVIFYRVLFHKHPDNQNIILRPYQSEIVQDYTFIIDANGNREKISNTQYEDIVNSQNLYQ